MGFLDTTAGKVIGVGAITASLFLTALEYNAQNQREADKTLELTCEQLSKQDVTVRGIDGTAYRRLCNEYGIPAPQVRRK